MARTNLLASSDGVVGDRNLKRACKCSRTSSCLQTVYDHVSLNTWVTTLTSRSCLVWQEMRSIECVARILPRCQVDGAHCAHSNAHIRVNTLPYM